MAKQTPWGPSQSADEQGPGVVFYSTAGHGGYHVTGAAAERMRRDFPEVWASDDAYAPDGWFEEDCGWCAVALCFPGYFDGQALGHAINTARSYWPEDVFTKHMETPEGRAATAKAAAWKESNKDLWEQRGFSGGSHGVSIPGRRIGDGARCEVSWGPQVQREWMKLPHNFTLEQAKALGAEVTPIRAAAA